MATSSPDDPRPLLSRLLGWVLVPLGWGGALIAAVVLLGIALLWQYPGLARKHKVELRDLVARSIDPHWADPFYVLQGREAWRRYKIDWNVSDDGKQQASGQVQSSSKKVSTYRYEHQVYKDRKPVFVKVTTTRNLNPPEEELKKAREQLQQLFPASMRGNPDRVVEWGRTVFTMWLRDEEDRAGRDTSYYKPDMAGEEECLWLAWRQLLADIPSAEKDLPRLQELVLQAYPKQSDREAAMKWARTLYGRLNETFQEWGKAAKVKAPAALPPASDFTYRWLLYQYVGLTDESRTVARQRWLSYFRSGKGDDVKKWGEKLEQQRRESGEALPPSSDNVALLCVIERIRGTDAYGEKCRRIVMKEVGTGSFDVISSAISLGGYPNDDFYVVFAADDPFHSYEIPALRWVIVICQLMMLIGLRIFLTSVLAERLLKLKDDPIYQRFRRRKPFYRDPVVLGTYLIVPFFAWLASFLTIPTDLALMVPPGRRLLGVYLSVCLGGTMLACLSRAIALLLIKAGVDPDKHWLDDAVALPLGIFILFHFQNDFFSILANVLIDLVPKLKHRLGQRGEGPSAEPGQQKREQQPHKKDKGKIASVWEQRGGKRPRKSQE